MRRVILGSAAFVACLCLAARAQADYIYQFTDSAGAEQNNFAIGSVGQTVDVNVWLKQSSPDDLLTNEGLYSAGVKLTYSTPGIAEVLSPSDITPNPAFDDPFALLKDIGSGYATLDMAADISGLNFPVFPPSSTDRVWLGTFTFTGLSPGSVQITAMDNPDSDNTLTGLGTVLDASIDSSQASINAVPEPSVLVVFAGLALVAGPYSLLRRRRQRAA